ncbi:MAG: tocopherol cyclase family protein [Firmicutes bacterium]|nr:tocopherol cyclase family protein [Bacillota bacterium]
MNVKNPVLFQGRKKKDHYFEGWYFKAVSSDELYSIALIPGVSINKIDPHSFIQLFISEKTEKDVSLQTYYFRFPLEDFNCEDTPFSVRIGNNLFSKEVVDIDLFNENVRLKGCLKISGMEPIKTSLYSPNIMGPFGYLNFMECYHGVVSMNHQINGSLQYNNQEISFKNAKGYIEKDWGKSFPSKYIWLQTNHFKESTTSLMLSYATIPLGALHFKGLIANMIIHEKEYRFATYNFSKIKITELKQDEVRLQIKKGRYKLFLHAKTEKQIELKSPSNGLMINQIKEGLSGWIHIKLYESQKLIYEDTGCHSGIEIMM